MNNRHMKKLTSYGAASPKRSKPARALYFTNHLPLNHSSLQKAPQNKIYLIISKKGEMGHTTASSLYLDNSGSY